MPLWISIFSRLQTCTHQTDRRMEKYNCLNLKSYCLKRLLPSFPAVVVIRERSKTSYDIDNIIGMCVSVYMCICNKCCIKNLNTFWILHLNIWNCRSVMLSRKQLEINPYFITSGDSDSLPGTTQACLSVHLTLWCLSM